MSPRAKAITITHELDLLENAIDSLSEALSKFEEGDAGDPKAYKFAVLHMAHFLELLFKHHIAGKHPLLIFKDPFSSKLDRNRTITLWDAINFINNESAGTISVSLTKDLEWIKRLRNDIEHHKFAMEVATVRVTMGRLFRSVIEFTEDYTDIDLASLIPEPTIETFQLLSDEYEFKVKTAIKTADEFEAENPGDYQDPDARLARLDCENCGNPTLIQNDDSRTGYRCLVCDNENGDEIPASCNVCGAEVTQGDLSVFIEDDGDTEYRCYYCSGRYQMDKND